MSDNNNLRFYDMGRSVPKNAQKQFDTGRFKGTDINPMWRIKKLTEMFGPVGFGWYTEIVRQVEIPAGEDNMMVFVDINLYVKEGDTWSKPIFGSGGNTIKTKGRGDDEGYKKAYTDALSIACKALGIGADIWYSADINADYSSKYANMYNDDERPKKPLKPATDEQKAYIKEHASDYDYMDIMTRYGAEMETMTEQDAALEIGKINSRPMKCEKCGNAIEDAKVKSGTITVAEIVKNSRKKFHGTYCFKCMMDMNKKEGNKSE